jgi:hypothetical protein
MASKQSTSRKPAKQSKSTQTDEQWHEERYGEHRDKLSTEQLKALVEDICGKNYDETAAAALCLLMDEFERSQFDRLHVDSMTITVHDAAFKYTTDHGDAQHAMIATKRREMAETEAVN